uniref:Uncharacterized protein n=1 Tax=Oryza rufipogon TaxID=4529 RepID=A0A0E0PMI9_ORYRU
MDLATDIASGLVVLLYLPNLANLMVGKHNSDWWWWSTMAAHSSRSQQPRRPPTSGGKKPVPPKMRDLEASHPSPCRQPDAGHRTRPAFMRMRKRGEMGEEERVGANMRGPRTTIPGIAV